jgi:ferritin-like metal-binding protein YciE
MNMSLDNLRELFHEQLKDIYSAEKQLTEALPKLADAASTDDLRNALNQHLEKTRNHMDQVGQLLNSMNVNPGSKKCKGMEGLVEEGNEMIQKRGDDKARDAGIVAAAQKAEHYEIATYGTLRTWARQLGDNNAAQTLQSILDEEYAADDKLTQIAESHLNREAMD